MNPITLPLIEIYPLVHEPFDQFVALRDNPGMFPHLPPAEIGFEINDPLSHAHRAVNLHNNLLPSLIEQKLNALPSFSQARAEMPRLQDIPAIYKYRIRTRTTTRQELILRWRSTANHFTQAKSFFTEVYTLAIVQASNLQNLPARQ